jgi:hypothetical protein
MGAGLALVLWSSVKIGLSLHLLSKLVVDPVGAAEDSARGIEISELRKQIRMLKRAVRPGSRLQSEAGRSAALVTAEARLAELLEMDDETVEVDKEQSPGLGMLKSADRVLGKWGPVLPLAVVGGNIFMEVMRIRRERHVGTVS